MPPRNNNIFYLKGLLLLHGKSAEIKMCFFLNTERMDIFDH